MLTPEIVTGSEGSALVSISSSSPPAGGTNTRPGAWTVNPANDPTRITEEMSPGWMGEPRNRLTGTVAPDTAIEPVPTWLAAGQVLLVPCAAVHSTGTALTLEVKPFCSVTSTELGMTDGVVNPVAETDAAVIAPALS